MNPQMDVLYLKYLGHVLAAFTRAAEPDQIETSAAAFVGDGLHLRGLPGAEDQDLIVPPAQIGILRTNLDWSLLRTPRNWYWDLSANPPAPVESVQTLTATTTPTPVLITSTSPASFAAGTTVRMLIEGSSLSSPLLVTLAPTSASVAQIQIPVPTLAPGLYYVIVFVPLYPITAANFTV
jgi:hypothetical protein